MSKRGRKNILILSYDEPLYIARCLNSKKYGVYIMGAAQNSIALSRFCQGFTPCSKQDIDQASGKIEKEINKACSLWKIDFIVPLGFPATVCLAKLKDRLVSPVFPTVSFKKLISLNNKWEFKKLLRKTEVPFPKTILIKKLKQLDHISLSYPFMVKMLDQYGSYGVKKINNKKELGVYKKTLRTDSFPVILQEFIPGDDVDLSVFAKKGEIMAWSIQKWRGFEHLEFVNNPKMLEIGKKIIRGAAYTGVAHFDMREDARGNIFVLECNPRFWGSANASILAGVDFIDAGIRCAQKKHVRKMRVEEFSYETTRQILKKLAQNPLYFAGLSKISRRDLLLVATDPLPYTASFAIIMFEKIMAFIPIGQLRTYIPGRIFGLEINIGASA